MISCRIGGWLVFEEEMSPMELLFLRHWTSNDNDMALAERLNRIQRRQKAEMSRLKPNT